MNEYSIGDAYTSKKDLHNIREGDVVYVAWHDGRHRLCAVRQNNNGNLIVETPNKGILEVTNYKALRRAQQFRRFF